MGKSKSKKLGIIPNTIISKKDCEKKGINKTLADLPPRDWCDLNKVADNAVKNSTLKQPSKLIKAIDCFLTKVSQHYKTDPTLSIYVTKIRKFYQAEQKQFEASIKLKLDEKNATEIKENSDIMTELYKESEESVLKTVQAKHLLNLAQQQLQQSNSISTNASSITTKSFNSNKSKEEKNDIKLFGDDELSVATRIKRHAVTLHTKFKNGGELSDKESHAMRCGLSSLLDLVLPSQSCLFTSEEWDALTKQFQQKDQQLSVDSRTNNNWNIIASLAMKEQDVYKSLSYIDQVKATNQHDLGYYKTFQVFEHVLNTIQNESFVLNIFHEGDPKQLKKVTEEDLLSKVWGPLLNGLLHINNRLRLKTGESVNDLSAHNKQSLYFKHNHITGFKIDMRFVFDYKDVEYDLAAGELAKSTSDASKIHHDESKLMRESKDVLDRLYDVNGNYKDEDLCGINLQISGLSAKVSSVSLVNNGLYVGTPICDLEFPHAFHKLHPFKKTFSDLLFIIDKLEKLSYKLQERLEEIYNNSIPLSVVLEDSASNDSESNDNTNDDIYGWKRPSWYTPPREDACRSIVPSNLFGRKRLRPSCNEYSYIDRNMPSQNNPTKEDVVADEFGFYKTDDNKYSNIHTPGVKYDELPTRK